MNICHVVNDLQSGGAQTFIVSLVNEQVKLGNKISILLVDESTNSPFEQKLADGLQKSGIKIVYLNRKRGKNFSILKSLKTCHTFFKEFKPDIINTHLDLSHTFIGLYRLFFKTQSKFKQIISIHCAPERWFLYTRLLNLHTPTIFCSYSAEILTRKRDCPSITIQNGISDFEIDNSADKLLKERNINGNTKLVLSVGRIAKQKNYSFIAEVAKECKDQNIKFLICGAPDNTFNEIEPLLSQDPIVYLGICSRNTIFSLMERSDCFLNASIYEGLPITVLEAFFSGTPCVLSSIMPHEEIGNDMPRCYLPESFDAKKYKDAIISALQYGDKKEETLEERIPHLAKYRIENTARLYGEFYQTILKG